MKNIDEETTPAQPVPVPKPYLPGSAPTSPLGAGDLTIHVKGADDVLVWLRDSKRTGIEELLARVRKIAEGAALMAEVESKLTVEGGDYEMLVNMAGAKLIQANFEWLGPIKYTAEEQEFARAIQRATGVEPKGLNGDIQPFEEPKPDPPGGSTDVADVSWIVPTLHLNVTTEPLDVPRHAWPVVAASGMSIGHKGMIRAGEVLAATAVDLFADPSLRESIRSEFRERTRGFTYRPLIPDGPPALPGP